MVEQKIELGRKLAALRESTPSNQIFGRTVRQRYDLHDAMEVAEMMRVARCMRAAGDILQRQLARLGGVGIFGNVRGTTPPVRG